jgi:hypothetical protein
MEDERMIPIVFERNVPFQQTFGKRRLLLLGNATRYTDGQQKLLWLTFRNNFVEPIHDIQLELTQFNGVQQVIEKSRIQIREFICAPRQEQTIASPIIIVDKCEAIGVRVLAASFRSLDLIDDRLIPAFSASPAVKPMSRKIQGSGPLKITNPLRWLPFWVSFWMAVALIIIVAAFQFNLI